MLIIHNSTHFVKIYQRVVGSVLRRMILMAPSKVDFTRKEIGSVETLLRRVTSLLNNLDTVFH